MCSQGWHQHPLKYHWPHLLPTNSHWVIALSIWLRVDREKNISAIETNKKCNFFFLQISLSHLNSWSYSLLWPHSWKVRLRNTNVFKTHTLNGPFSRPPPLYIRYENTVWMPIEQIINIWVAKVCFENVIFHVLCTSVLFHFHFQIVVQSSLKVLLTWFTLQKAHLWSRYPHDMA